MFIISVQSFCVGFFPFHVRFDFECDRCLFGSGLLLNIGRGFDSAAQTKNFPRRFYSVCCAQHSSWAVPMSVRYGNNFCFACMRSTHTMEVMPRRFKAPTFFGVCVSPPPAFRLFSLVLRLNVFRNSVESVRVFRSRLCGANDNDKMNHLFHRFCTAAHTHTHAHTSQTDTQRIQIYINIFGSAKRNESFSRLCLLSA